MTTAAATGIREPRVRGPARRAFIGAAAALFVLFMGNNVPSALYGLLRGIFGFSSLTQTLLYAVPVVLVILPGLLVFGTLSDVAGRRTLVLGGLAAFAAGDAAFMLADDTAWLLAARLAQGLGIALAMAASTATLSDSAGGLRRAPVAAQRMAALAGTISITGGLAIGPLVGGLLAQYAPAPRITPLAVHLGLVAVALALAWPIPGRSAGGAGRWRLTTPRIPDAIRPRFRVIAVAELLCWAVLGVFSAVIAALLGSILHTGNLALTAGGLFVAIAASAAAQVDAPRLAPPIAQVAGLSILACGLMLLLAADGTSSVALVVLAMAGSGIGHGLVFAGNLAEVTVATPAAERGAVLGAIYFVNYAGLGIPVIGVGVLSLWTGLETATTIAAIVIAVGCIVLIPFVVRRRADLGRGALVMQGNVTVTPAGAATIHTYTAPEVGWRANSHVIELASQVVLFDAPLTQEYAREVLGVAGSLGKPVTRLYISHAHPDHFAGAAAIDAPSYSLGPVKDLIDRSGDLRIQRGYACTPGHSATPPPRSRPVDHTVLPGADETLDGVQLRFEAVADAETNTQLVIALPGTGVLISQDVLYNGVHPFLGEHAFDTWRAAITALEALPYETIIPGHGLPRGDGLPSGRAIYAANREYLTVAAAAFAEATGPEDLNKRLEAAFPSYGGTAMQGLQNFYLYP